MEREGAQECVSQMGCLASRRLPVILCIPKSRQTSQNVNENLKRVMKKREMKVKDGNLIFDKSGWKVVLSVELGLLPERVVNI